MTSQPPRAGTRATGAPAGHRQQRMPILLSAPSVQQFLVRGAATTSRPVCAAIPAGVSPVRMAPLWIAPYGAGTANPGPYGVRLPSAPSVSPAAPGRSPSSSMMAQPVRMTSQKFTIR